MKQQFHIPITKKKINEALNKINKYIDLAKKAMMVIIGVTGVILVLLS
ncbi:MAG: hypothetical protein V8R39_03780 [Clostridia bacterium]